MVEGVKAGVGVGGPAQATHNATGTTDGPFIVNGGTEGPAQNVRVSSVAGIGLATLLALQAVEETTERDRTARKHGVAMLAALTNLQRAMLVEGDPSSALRALTELTANTPSADDPGLGAVLQAVVLRSRVELARRERQLS